MTARVYVTLKKAVLDPQGKAVQRSLARLGFPQMCARSLPKPLIPPMAATDW